MLFIILKLCLLLSSLLLTTQGTEYKYFSSREGQNVCKADGVRPYQGLLKKLFCTNEKVGIKCENDKFCNSDQSCSCNHMCEEFRCSKKVFVKADNKTQSCTLKCLNGGTCRIENATKLCICKPGFEGEDCGVSKDACYPNPCKNDGKCQYVKTHNFSCKCSDDYTGVTCDILKNACLNDKQCNNTIAPCKMRGNESVCECQIKGMEGDNCEIDIDECKLNNICGYNGRCINTLGSYYCNCTEGWYGTRCENKKNYCEAVVCANGGSCTEEGTGYKCACVDGYSGPNCTKQSVCNSTSCVNLGQCTEKGCICTSEFTGMHCETKKTCLHPTWACKNNGTCNSSGDTTICSCINGFTGARCETNLDKCSGVNCHNGTCIGDTVTYHCQCDKGYTGKTCKNKINYCSNNPCIKGTCIDGLVKYTCVCQNGYTGQNCDIANKVCPFNDCNQSFDGSTSCKQKCNIPDCNFDEGDCALGVKSPWQNCSQKNCWTLFGDGTCNAECNTPLCLFDGNDCSNSKKKCSGDHFCRTHFNNSKCDRSCNTVECGFDGEDCIDDDIVNVPGNLIFTVLQTRSQFEDSKIDFLRRLSSLLLTKVVIDKIEEIDETYTRLKKRALKTPKLRVTTSLENPSNCDSGCFTSTTSAANYLAARASKGTLNLPVPIYSVQATKGSDPSGKPTLSPLWIAVICLCVPALILMVGGGVRKVVVNTWYPGGHRRHPTNLREPGVGQEGDAMMMSLKHDSPDSESVTGSSGGSAASSAESPRDSKRFKLDTCIQQSNDWLPPLREHQLLPVTDSSDAGSSIPSPITYDIKNPETNLHLAARLDRIELANQLISIGFDINSKDKSGRSPLHVAVSNFSAGVFQALIRNRQCHIDFQANDGQTPLMLACSNCSYFMVDDLISTGAKVNLTDKKGNTALHYAAKVENDRSVYTLLKNGGAKVDAQNHQGETPLFLAAAEGALKCANVLMSHYANRNASDNMEVSPLAIARSKGHNDLVRLLSSCGSTPSPIQSPPVSPSNYSEIRPKTVPTTNAPQPPLHFEPAYKIPANKRKRKPSSKKEKQQPMKKISDTPYRFMDAYPTPRTSVEKQNMHSPNHDIFMHNLCNVQDCFDSWNHQTAIQHQQQQQQQQQINFMAHPFPTPPSNDIASPDLTDIDFNPSIFLTPSPESFPSPESGTYIF